jgi:3,4-dihydroxy 2-butanone 4-phosphate synthase/GTP cyclohydrolase II
MFSILPPRRLTRSRYIVPISEALEEIRAGRMIILMDDEDRENEGDLCMAAESVTGTHINFMATYGRGLICLPLTEEKLEELGLPMMVSENRASLGTAFTVSIDARHGTTRGISATDRATTIRTATRDGATPSDLVSPGHVFPLRARPGGVLVRAGQTEGAVDLARLAGLKPAGVICEIMSDDGSMARLPELEGFAVRHRLKIATVADLIQYRLHHDSLVRCVATARLISRYGRRASRAGQRCDRAGRADASAYAHRIPAGRRLWIPGQEHGGAPPPGHGVHCGRGTGCHPLSPARNRWA